MPTVETMMAADRPTASALREGRTLFERDAVATRDRIANHGDPDHAVPLRENGVGLPISWDGDQSPASLKGKQVQLRFLMQNAKLFSFRFWAFA